MNQLNGKLEHTHADPQPGEAGLSPRVNSRRSVGSSVGCSPISALSSKTAFGSGWKRNTIRAEFKRLLGKYELLKSERDNDRSEHQRLSAELATIREALGASTPEDIGILRAEHESLRRDRDRIVAELGTLREDRNAIQSQHNSIQAQLEQLRGELDRLGSEHDQERQEHQRLGAEYATIQEALGTLTPEDIGILKVDHESLRRDRDRIVAELGTLREDHNAIQSQRDSIQAQLEQLRGELDRLGSEHDQERQNYHRLGAELATIREALEPFTPGEISSLKAERASFKTETDRLRKQVQTLRGDLSAGQSCRASCSA